MFLGSLSAIAFGAALPLLLVLWGETIDNFVVYDATGGGGGGGNSYSLLEETKDLVYYYIYIACAVVVLGYMEVTFWLIAAYRQGQKIRMAFFRAIMRQNIGWFDSHRVGELNARLNDDVNKIVEGIGDKIGIFFQWFSTFIFGISVGFYYGWKLAAVIMSVSPLLVICGYIMNKLSALASEGELGAYAKAGSVAQQALAAIRTVHAFGGQNKEAERYKSRLYEAQLYGVRKSVYNGIAMGFMWLIVYSVYGLAFWYGIKLTIDEPENYTAGRTMIVFFCVVIGAFSLGNAGPNLQKISTARGAAHFIFQVIDRKSPIDSSSLTGKTPKSIRGTVALFNVDFAYPARPEVQVLDDVCLQTKVGQIVALVGHSGCGKSTIVQLLQRFYDPRSGAVTIDGVNLRDYNVRWLRQNIGVVSQEPVLFDTTIKENIMFGREGCSMNDVIQATKLANAFDFIQKLPEKFETLVGERGAQLSGGQKQRIAIARALVRNPKILLLDEATSALDTESEAVVQDALNKASQGRTTIVIAHRLSTIKNAKIIYGFDSGRIVEKGTHEQLMSGPTGVYQTLVKNQAAMTGHEDDDVQSMVLGPTFSDGSAGKAHYSSTGVLIKDNEEEEEVPPMSWKRAMRLNKPESCYIAFGCLGALVCGAVQPAFAIAFAEMLGVYALPPDERMDKATLWAGVFLAVAGAACISNIMMGYFFGISGERLTMRLRDLTFRAYLRQEIAYFDDHRNNTGALCTRLSNDCSLVHGATGVSFGSAFMNLASLGAGLVIGFVYSWKLALLVVAFGPAIAIGGLVEMQILQGTTTKSSKALEEAGKTATEAIGNIRTVASLTREKYFIDEYTRKTEKPNNAAICRAHGVGLAFSMSQSTIYFAYAAIFYLGAYLVEKDGLDYVDMMKVFGAIIFGASAAGQMSHFAPDAGKASVAGGRIFQLIDRVPAIDSTSGSDEGTKPSFVKGEIRFTSVAFHYPTRPTVQVLRNLNLDVSLGRTIALVGTSGCGKSTAVALLERFYDVTDGSVQIDGNDVRELNIHWLRAQMAIVQQEPILFDTSIRENIAYGSLDDQPSMADVIQAARDANIHEFISNLPDGYETNVGDKGTQLSGGQKQRIAIARALIRNPKILLLDEATSALDTESERVVQEALDRAQKGRTCVVIAHRLSTIQNSDCIAVIRGGIVKEKGTHGELLAQQGAYFSLHVAQKKKV